MVRCRGFCLLAAWICIIIGNCHADILANDFWSGAMGGAERVARRVGGGARRRGGWDRRRGGTGERNAHGCSTRGNARRDLCVLVFALRRIRVYRTEFFAAGGEGRDRPDRLRRRDGGLC